ncbi:hypothetical protein QJU27_10040, partial [Pasteurella atlantica]|uniref:hypothetical protein n=1 Tax=Pasteurella atlantica TaxID=2827233 RepID=UPI00275CEF16
DKDGDGTPELITTKKDTDSDGKDDTVTVSEDINDDGTIDKVTTTVDMNEDGNPEKIIETVNNDDGSITTTTTIPDKDGVWRSNENVAIETDANGDGKSEKVIATTTSQNGNVTTAEGDITHNPDGSKEIKYTVTNDNFELREGMGDEVIKAKKITRTDTVDKDGNIVKEVFDYNNDGTPDKILEHSYDSDGNRVKTVNKFDGHQFEESTTREFDKDGNVTKEYIDYDNDGNPDTIKTFEYDETGNQQKVYTDKNADDVMATFEYDSKGNVTHHTSILDLSNPNAKYDIVYNRDESGREV